MTSDLKTADRVDELVDELAQLPAGKRRLVAIAGAPGSGKSTIAAELTVRLNRMEPNRAAILPMDGFHFDDAILAAIGRLAAKGAPDTFDVGGLLQILRRLKANTEDAIAVPVFDRHLELSRGAARLIPRSTEIILVEGNYLLSTERPWGALRSHFDLAVFLDVPEPVLRERLLRRWRDHGFGEAEARKRAEGNDIPNGAYVRENSATPDIVIAIET